MRYFLATPFILVANVFAFIANIISDSPVMVMDLRAQLESGEMVVIADEDIEEFQAELEAAGDDEDLIEEIVEKYEAKAIKRVEESADE